MATLRNKRKIAAVSSETPENTRNSQSQNTLDPEMAQGYICQVSEEIEGRVTKKLSKEFSRRESPILGALSKLDEFLLNPQVRTCSIALPGTSRSSGSENREPTGDRSLGDPCPDAVFSNYHSSNLNDSEQEDTHHNYFTLFSLIFFKKPKRSQQSQKKYNFFGWSRNENGKPNHTHPKKHSIMKIWKIKTDCTNF